ncbi:tetratricopeptide repeat protein [Alkalibacterium olivapovliticus]|uniref:Tfp pilus assembly protein PilF n=1 Tax=Alkalibacterium olivapovliticus TaxID=99907 RepID=A0A2T0W959_9LACT|nr:tetratricopeptide repeat protein [Alkalibacterium olivapovliticus]PRY83239.1 Tfp pilus assembly protein PilF [Alkalibacterium olivapovliticus]
MSYSSEMIEALQNEKLSEADDLLKKAIAYDPDEDLFALVETLYDLGFLDETKQVVQHLLALNPQEEGLKLTLAEISIEEGNELEAFEWIEQIKEDSPFYPQALLVAADYYQVLELPEVAQQKLEEAKTLLPDEPVIDFALGELLFTAGKYKEAIAHYEQLILKEQTEFAGTSLNGRLGNAYAAIGDLESAIDYFNEAIELHETIDLLFQLGLVYFQKKDYDKANEYFFKVKEADPSYTTVYTYLGKGYIEQADEKHALEVVEEGLFYDKQNASLYAMGANAAKSLGHLEKADSYFQEAIKLDPENITLTLEYAQLLFNQLKFEKALEIFTPKLDSGEEDPQLFWYAAIAYNEQELFEDARELYDKAAIYLSENAEFLKDYAVFLREDGDKEGFLNTAKRYIKINPDDDEVIEWIKYEDSL